MIRIGIISPADIAFRRFMPALLKNKNFKFIGLAIYSRAERFQNENISLEEQEQIMQKEWDKGKNFLHTYDGKLFRSYQELIMSDEIDAIYLPLPPALHYVYGKQILEQGKHLLIEKPATVSLKYSQELATLAALKELALCENYMFVYHKQIDVIQQLIADNVIGEIRLLSMKFGFPKRMENDFRYKKQMGGGALFDACGYPVRLATLLLGDNCDVVSACLNTTDGYEVDMYGSATIVNVQGVTAQIAYGMDNEYRCELEIWGSKGMFKTNRIFTAPADYVATGVIIQQGKETPIELGMDDAFANSLQHFYECIQDSCERSKSYKALEKQAQMIEKIGDRNRDKDSGYRS